MENNQIILFDGNCMLCNKFIIFIIKKEITNLYFCDFNSRIANELLTKNNLSSVNKNTIYYISNNIILSKSKAILKIIGLINLRYKIVSLLLSIIPKSIRDAVYTIISKNRYKLKFKTCYVPSITQRKMILN